MPALGQRAFHLNRIQFEKRRYVCSQAGNAPVRDTSGPNYQTAVSKVDVV